MTWRAIPPGEGRGCGSRWWGGTWRSCWDRRRARGGRRRDQLLGRLVQAAEQAKQGFPVRLAQRTEDLREQPLPGGVRHMQGGPARVGDRDQLGPAIYRVRPAFGHAETFQPVDDVGDGVRGQREIGRQHALPGRPLLAETPEYL